MFEKPRHPVLQSLIVLVLLVSSTAVIDIPAAKTVNAAPAVQTGDSVLLAPAIDEPSSVGEGVPTYEVFHTSDVEVFYEGGPICLSSQPNWCSPPAIDDAVRISVNGQAIFYYKSYTHDFGPIEFSGYLSTGVNAVRTELIDLQGPRRGGSALWLVIGTGGGGNPLLNVSVSRSGDFFSPDGQGGSTSIEGQSRANVPFEVTVTQDGVPVAGAELRLRYPFDAYVGTTDQSGLAQGNIAVAIPSQSEVVYIEVEATVDGLSASSGLTSLYHVDEQADFRNTLTQDEVDAWGWQLLRQYALEPDIPVEYPGLPRIGLIVDLIDTLAFFLVRHILYSPQVGDQARSAVYQFSADGMTTAYLYHASVARNGEVAYEHNYFTADYSKVEPYTIPPARHGLGLVIASPAILYLTNPDGHSAGIHPLTGQRVFEFPLALSEVNDEPFQAFAPSAPPGEYLLQVIGIGYGSYTISVNALDENGIGSEVLQVTGLTEPGYITTFKIRYDPAAPHPVRLAVVGTVDFKPDTLNLDSRSGRNAITAYVELPLGFDVASIDPSLVYLEGSVPAQLRPTAVGDENGNQVPDLMIKFDRQAVIDYLRSQAVGKGEVILVLHGAYIGPVEFEASESIRIIAR